MDTLQEPEQAEQSLDAVPAGAEAGEGDHSAGSDGATLEGAVDSLTLAELQQQAAELGAAAGAMEGWTAMGMGAPFWGVAIPVAVVPYQLQDMPDVAGQPLADPSVPLELLSAANALRGTLRAALGGDVALEAGGSSLMPAEALQLPAAGAAAGAMAADPGLWLQTEPGALLGEAVPLLLSQPLEPGPRRAAPRKRRARILKDGQLTMIVYGQNEALLWAKRIASFQNAMRMVLGDRRRSFTWGGSIIDSVVGAFLTQNVSDFLSSKAFMELASRFPARRPQAAQQAAQHGERAGPGVGADHPPAQQQLGGSAESIWLDSGDTVDWEAVRTAPQEQLSDAIKCRGMQFFLARRIQTFLNSVIAHNKRRLAALAGQAQLEEEELEARDERQQLQQQSQQLLEQEQQEQQQLEGEEAEELLRAEEMEIATEAPLLEEDGHASRLQPMLAALRAGSSGGQSMHDVLPASTGGAGSAEGLESWGQEAQVEEGRAASTGGTAMAGSLAAAGLAWEAGLPGPALASSGSGQLDAEFGTPSGGQEGPPVHAGSAGDLSGSGGQEASSAQRAWQGRLERSSSGGSGPSSPKRRRTGPIQLEYEEEGAEEGRNESQALGAAAVPLVQAFPQEPPEGQAEGVAGKGSGEGSLLSLEWLREASDEECKEYLLSIEGLGRKSVACIMLLTLGRKEFPVDTNVGRICARLGWIPLDSDAAVEDLDDYAPEPEVHKYLHQRLMGFELETLYELHYQMITLGKVFCNKAAPNCRACPMAEECEYALNNGPSLHGRKRQRQAQLAQQAQQLGQQAQQQGAGELGAAAAAVAPASPPPQRAQRGRPRKRNLELDLEEDPDELELLQWMPLPKPQPQAGVGGAGAAGRRHRQGGRRPHQYAQPVELLPGDVDLDAMLRGVPRQHRTGPLAALLAPAAGVAAGQGGEEDSRGQAGELGAESEGEEEEEGVCPASPGSQGEKDPGIVHGSGQEGRQGAAAADAADPETPAGNAGSKGQRGSSPTAGVRTRASRAAAQQADAEAGQREGGLDAGGVTTRSGRHTGGAPAPKAKALGGKAAGKRNQQQPAAAAVAEAEAEGGITTRSGRHVPAPKPKPAAAAEGGSHKGEALPPEGQAGGVTTHSGRQTRGAAKAEAGRGAVPSAEGAGVEAAKAQAGTAGAGKEAAGRRDAKPDSTSEVAELPEGSSRALRRAARAQASLHAAVMSAGAAAGAAGASVAAAAGSAPGTTAATAPAGFTTRSGRQVKRHWAADMEVDEEELPGQRKRAVMPPLPPVAAGREAGEDRKPRGASPEYLPWLFRNAPRKLRSPWQPRPAAAQPSAGDAEEQPPTPADGAQLPAAQRQFMSAESEEGAAGASSGEGGGLEETPAGGSSEGVDVSERAAVGASSEGADGLEEETGPAGSEEVQAAAAAAAAAQEAAAALAAAEAAAMMEGWSVGMDEELGHEWRPGWEGHSRGRGTRGRGRGQGRVRGRGRGRGQRALKDTPQRAASAQEQEELGSRERSCMQQQQQLQPAASEEEQPSGGEGEEGSSEGVDVAVLPAAPPPAVLMAAAAAALAAKKTAAAAAAAAMSTEAATAVAAAAAEGAMASTDGRLMEPQGEETGERGAGCPTEDGSGEAGSSPAGAEVSPAPAAPPSPALAAASQLPPTPSSQPAQAAEQEAAAVGSPEGLATEAQAPFSTEASEAAQPMESSPTPASAPASAPAATAAAAAAAAEQAQRSAAEECERLLSLGEQLSAVQAAMAVAAGGNGNTSVHKQRLVELGLQMLRVDMALHSKSAPLVLSAARRQYHLLSMRTHPDKCTHPVAQRAFAVLSHAFTVVSEAAAAAAAGQGGTWAHAEVPAPAPAPGTASAAAEAGSTPPAASAAAIPMPAPEPALPTRTAATAAPATAWGAAVAAAVAIGMVAPPPVEAGDGLAAPFPGTPLKGGMAAAECGPAVGPTPSTPEAASGGEPGTAAREEGEQEEPDGRECPGDGLHDSPGAGPCKALGAVVAPLPVADQLVWTQQRRVVQAYVVPPASHSRLPPLPGITGTAGTHGDPLLFVPLAALDADAKAAAAALQRLIGLPALPAAAAATVQEPGVELGSNDSAGSIDVRACAAASTEKEHELTTIEGGLDNRASAGTESCSPQEQPAHELPPAPASQVLPPEGAAAMESKNEQTDSGVSPGHGAVEPQALDFDSSGEGGEYGSVPVGEEPVGSKEAAQLLPEQPSETAARAAYEAAAASEPSEQLQAAGAEEAAAAGAQEDASAAPSRLPNAGEELAQEEAATAAAGEGLGIEGVILVTCRSAMGGRFPLNGTYFQVNEVFADQSTADAPIQVSSALLAECECCAVHFGHSIHYMTKGMTQMEVANMFAHGYVCFRGFDPLTGAPTPLPTFLAPSVPKTAPSTWKNKAQRAAERAAKAAAAQGLQPPGAWPAWQSLQRVRQVPVPLSPDGFVPPPAVVSHEAWEQQQQQQQQLLLEQLGGSGSVAAGLGIGLGLQPLLLTPQKRRGGVGPGSPGPFTPPAPANKRRKAEQGGEDVDLDDPAVRKSGKGRTRVHEFPVVRSSQRCGQCDTCLNRHWKKACLTRRAEMEKRAEAAASGAEAGG